MNRKNLVLLLAPLSLLLLVACGGGGAASTATGPSRTGVSAQSGQAQSGQMQSTPAQAGQAQAGQATDATGSKPAADAAIPALTVPEGPRVQRRARIALQVANGRFDDALNGVIGTVEQAGGYISGQEAQAVEAGEPLRSGQATFQVPATKFESVVSAIRKLGTSQSISISGNDVSQQYVDLQARLRNAEAQRNAMLALMQQAKTVGETIQIQSQLGQVTAQIEQLKGQIDYLDHSTTYATLSVTIREAAAAGVRDEWGVQTATMQALHNLVGVLAFLILAVGTLIPVLIVGAALLLAGRPLWRRLTQRSPRPAVEPVRE